MREDKIERSISKLTELKALLEPKSIKIVSHLPSIARRMSLDPFKRAVTVLCHDGKPDRNELCKFY